PEISYEAATAGAIHPIHLLQFVFADLYGAMSEEVPYWGPASNVWYQVWGSNLFLSQNMPLVYAGALPFVAVIAFGLIRGLVWACEIRFFTIAAGLMVLYAIGDYTPVYHAMYELPGLWLYRRPADA